MSALTVLVIRHAEKPEEPVDEKHGPGLTAAGDKDKHSLIIRGWQRAGAWAALFGQGVNSDYPRPDVVYAADPGKTSDADDTNSKRPFETIRPLCKRLQITPVTKYGVGDEPAMVGEVLKQKGTVLISWEHKMIIKSIIHEIVKPQSVPNLPPHWDGTRFDVVLRFDRPQVGASWKFRQLFPQLLSGDLDKPVEQKE
jgi:hypothetical protein